MPRPMQLPAERGSFGMALWALSLAVALSFIVQFEPAPYDLLMVAIFGAATMTGLIRMQPGSAIPIALFGVFALANFMSALFSFDFNRSLLYMAVTFYMMASTILVMMLMAENEERVLDHIWKAYVVAAVIASILGVIGYFHLAPGSEVFIRGGRARGLFKDPNVYGPFIVPVVLYLFYRFETGRGTKSLWPLLLVPIVAIGVLVSFSRGAWGNLVISFMLYIVLRTIVSLRGRAGAQGFGGLGRVFGAATAVIVIAAGLASWTIANTQAGQTFSDKAQIYRYYDDDRFGAQSRGLQTAMENPIGIGPGLSEQFINYAVHSLYVRLFLENGWLGGVAFLSFLLVTLWRGFSLIMRGEAHPLFLVAYVSIIGIMINGVVIDTVHWRHFFLVLGLSWGSILVAEARLRSQRRGGYR